MFGVYSAAGVIATLGLLFLFLPSWMQLWPMKPHSLLDGDQPKAEDIALPVRWPQNSCRACSTITGWCSCGLGLHDGGLRHRAVEDQHLDQAYEAVFVECTDHSRLPVAGMQARARWCRWKSSFAVDNTQARSMTFLERMELIGGSRTDDPEIHDIGCTMSATTFAPSLEVTSNAVRCATPSVTR